MGLLSSIGKIAGGFFGGPIGGALGGALGGAIDDRNDRSAQRKMDAQEWERHRNRFAYLQQDAAKGGFHPLEALRATGAPGGPRSTPRVMTSLATQNAFDQLDEVLSGRQAAADKRQELEDELLRTQIDSYSRTGKLGRISEAAFPKKAAATTSGQKTTSSGDHQTTDVVDEKTIPGSDPGETGNRGTRREPTPDLPLTMRVGAGDMELKGLNPEATETGLGEAITAGVIYAPQIAAKTFNRAIDGNAENNGEPFRPGRWLGETVKKGSFEFQWTKQGWKPRALKMPKIAPHTGRVEPTRNYK